MKILHVALATALSGVALAGCSDSGGGSAPAASTSQPAEPAVVAQPADTIVEEDTGAEDTAQADAQPDTDVAVDMTQPVVDVTAIPAPPIPASVTDLGTATEEELRLELETLRPKMADLRRKYRELEIPLRKTQSDLRQAIDNGDSAQVVRLREEQQTRASEYLPAINEFREARARLRAIEARIPALPEEPEAIVEPQPDDASN